jgi:hypothetical protein
MHTAAPERCELADAESKHAEIVAFSVESVSPDGVSEGAQSGATGRLARERSLKVLQGNWIAAAALGVSPQRLVEILKHDHHHNFVGRLAPVTVKGRERDGKQNTDRCHGNGQRPRGSTHLSRAHPSAQH